MTLDKVEVELSSVVSEAVEAFREDAALAGCALHLKAASPVIGHFDPQRVKQAVSILLSNALKFGPHQPIDVIVGRHNGTASISVVDHGIGLSEEGRTRLFGRFERAVSYRNYGGFGLGLWLARHIVEAHAGHIDVRDTPGGGATFILTIPHHG